MIVKLNCMHHFHYMLRQHHIHQVRYRQEYIVRLQVHIHTGLHYPEQIQHIQDNADNYVKLSKQYKED